VNLVAEELRRLDRRLAETHGAYFGFRTEAGPVRTDDWGLCPAAEVDRLLDRYAGPETRFLDVGCGAGQTLCRLAARVGEAWGVDMLARPLEAARLRAAGAGLRNVTFVHGDTTAPQTAAQLPEARFDLALSRRGPNLTAALVRALTPDALAVQELVGAADCARLRVFLGRAADLPYQGIGHGDSVRAHLEAGLFPVASTEFFYEEVYRDADHLEAYLRQNPANVSDWRLGPRPYDPATDRPGLELYCRYHATADGVRLRRHRWVFVRRRAPTRYYPVDHLPGAGAATG
jgi:SAM-dependent methyltransferase